jgi:hypothetical protein
LRFRAFGEHQEGHVSPAAGFVEGLAIGRLVVNPDRLEGREFVPARHTRDGEPLPVRELPDPDRAADEAGRIGVRLEGVVSNEGGLVLVGAVIARAGGDGAKALNRGDEREAALFRVLLVEDEGVNLAAERIEAEAPGPVDEQGEFVVGRVARDRAPDEGEVARVIERREAHNGRQLGAAGWRACSDSPDEGDAPVRRGDTGDQWMEGLDRGERLAAFFRVREGRGLLECFLPRADRLGEPVLIEFGRLRLPPARRDMSSGATAIALRLASARESVAVGVRRVLRPT